MPFVVPSLVLLFLSDFHFGLDHLWGGDGIRQAYLVLSVQELVKHNQDAIRIEVACRCHFHLDHPGEIIVYEHGQ